MNALGELLLYSTTHKDTMNINVWPESQIARVYCSMVLGCPLYQATRRAALTTIEGRQSINPIDLDVSRFVY